jgi:hypothetical protein
MGSNATRILIGLGASIFLAACDKAPAPPATQGAAVPPAAPVALSPVAPLAASAPAVSVPAQAATASPAAPAGVPKSAPNAPVVSGNVSLAPAPKASPIATPVIAHGYQTTNFIGAVASMPTDWQATPPTNSMRVAQFLAPPPKGGEGAEMVVFYFAPGRGGSQEENISRWASQFTSAAGGPATPKIERVQVNGMPVTRVELAGSYSRGVGMGSAGDVKTDQVLLAAILTTPAKGNVTLHLYGPKAAVEQQRKAFDNIVGSLRPSGH